MRRIIGIEHEIDALFHDQSGEPIWETRPRTALLDSFFVVARERASIDKVPSYFGETTGRIILPNGGMLYPDQGNPEICLPECKDPREVVIYDKAADILLTELLNDWHQSSSKPPGSAHLRLHKKNTGILPNVKTFERTGGLKVPSSRAFHENYLVRKSLFEKLTHEEKDADPADFPKEVKFFVLFLIVRYLITGSGGIVCNPHQGTRRNPSFDFVVSPRFSNIEKVMGPGTVSAGERSILNTKRGESLMGSLPYDRLHIICGDSNMMEKSLWLTVGITSLILELLEHNFWDDNLALMVPRGHWRYWRFNDFLRDLNQDYTGQTRLELLNGRRMSVLEILWRYYELCESYALKYKKKRHEKILKEWRRVLIALETDWRDLIGVLGWPTLRWLVCGENAEKNKLHEEEAHRLNFEFHNVNTREGLYYQLLDDFERITTDEEILAAVSNPPKTRASLRALLCNRVKDLGFSLNCAWNAVTFWDDPKTISQYTVKMENPYLWRIRKSQIDGEAKAAMIKLGFLKT